ncbi:GNAT family acetyltransferase [Natronospirillum operosum]|uniref:GNAT family acetyltransferase n=1 Tax=Natronospirillum operosum TaxID=2759953 RepID=A0A4Z0WCT7_9GAMM|nr:GNAT family acetyltransferase [Natronospirillum operosum]TGG91682.1 GNAT family acetyltransferase [Natronospirillum operosum]
MNIRPFQEADRSAVITLWQGTGLTVPQNDPDEDINRKLRVDPELFLIGEINGEVVATVMAGYEGHRGWINYLAVSPMHQRNGYARQLMETAERLLKKRGCPKINLQVRATNVGVIEFYAALGYGDDHVVGLGKRLVNDT